MLPILTIRLELSGSELLFNPSLDEDSASLSVQECVDGWLNDFLSRGDAVRPVHEDLKVTTSCNMKTLPRALYFSKTERAIFIVYYFNK